MFAELTDVSLALLLPSPLWGGVGGGVHSECSARSGACFGKNSLANNIGGPQHVMVPKSHDAVALRLKPSTTAGIPLGCLLRMLPAVHFDDQFPREPSKIDDVRSDWALSAEMQAERLQRSQDAPKPGFRIRRTPAERLRLPPRSLVDCGVRHDPTAPANPAPAPSAPPSPQRGRGRRRCNASSFTNRSHTNIFTRQLPPRVEGLKGVVANSASA